MGEGQAMANTSDAQSSVFIAEAEVSERWPMLPLSDLRRARRHHEIAFYRFPVGAHYKAADIEAFLEWKYRECPARRPAPTAPASSATLDGLTAPSTSTSRTPSAEATTTPASTTPEVERLRAAAFELRTSRRPKSALSQSPTRRPPRPAARRSPETSRP